jgi:hypothetical protein
MGILKSKLKKPKLEIIIDEESNSIPENIHICILGGINYTDEIHRILDIFSHNRLCVKIEHQYIIYAYDVNLYFDIENERSYARRYSCDRYSPFMAFDVFVIIGDLLSPKFPNQCRSWMNTIEYYSNKEKIKMIMGFDGCFDICSIQHLLLRARYDEGSILYSLPKEIVFILIWYIQQEIHPIPLRDTANIQINNNILDVSSELDIQFFPVSLRSGYNIEAAFLNLICSTLDIKKEVQ